MPAAVSRRVLLVGAAAAGVGACGAKERGPRRPGVARADVAALNAALAFEHLEAGFYARSARRLGGQERRLFERFAAQEAEHVATLSRSIRDAGGRPVRAAAGRVPDAPLEAALALEELRAAAWLGQLDAIANAGLLALALATHAVEARQAVALRGLAGRAPGPAAALGVPVAPAEALERARELLA
jgi:rubrerythrin